MYFRSSKRGFALAEIIVALFFVSMAIMLVGGLGQQVMQLARNSKQTAAVIELRSKSNAITRNVDSWLAKMRSSANTGGVFASCIPDPSAASSIYSCPAINDNILPQDAELQRIAGTQLHAASVPIVDLMGDLIAGTESSPLLLDLDGRACTTNCPLKSIGYILRSNPDTDSNPGSVRFVVKLIPQAQPGSGSTPLRTQYFTMDLGMEWAQPAGFCPSGTLKVGYLSSGKPNCINPSKKCASGTIHLGLDSSGNPICKAPPTSCAGTGGSVVINAAGDDLVCATSTPCDANQIFLGYYSGTGAPMCSTTNLSCPDGQVQIGIAQNGGSLQATCKQLPSCNDSQKLSYDGSQFVCASASVASTCQSGEVVVGINEDGSAKCEAAQRNLASTNLTCPSGQYVSGLRPDGEVICDDLPSSGGGSNSSSPIALTNTDLSYETHCSWAVQWPKISKTCAPTDCANGDTSLNVSCYLNNLWAGTWIIGNCTRTCLKTENIQNSHFKYTIKCGWAKDMENVEGFNNIANDLCETDSCAHGTNPKPKTCRSTIPWWGSSWWVLGVCEQSCVKE